MLINLDELTYDTNITNDGLIMTYVNKLDGNRIFRFKSKKDLYLYNDLLNDFEIDLTFSRSHIIFNEEKQAKYIEDYDNSNDKFFFVMRGRQNPKF
jgi:hypothetical protein